MPAGIVSSLSEKIVDFSGFATAKTAKRILEEKRSKAGQVRSLMKAFILATITAYSPEDLDEFTYSQLAERVALAEKIIEIKQAINGMQSTNVSLSLIDPEEEEQRKQEEISNFEKSRKDGEARFDDPIAQKLWGSQ
jgi:hypothetical protein